jgi:hypothetical protein
MSAELVFIVALSVSVLSESQDCVGLLAVQDMMPPPVLLIVMVCDAVVAFVSAEKVRFVVLNCMCGDRIKIVMGTVTGLPIMIWPVVLLVAVIVTFAS